jgi:hypothetical protein
LENVPTLDAQEVIAYIPFCVFRVFESEDYPLWLKNVAEINTIESIAVLMNLYSFIV